MVEWYKKNDTELTKILKVGKKGARITEEFKKIHDLNKFEIADFEKKIYGWMQTSGRIEKEGTEVKE